MSMVVGCFMLKPDPTTTNYILILVGFGLFFLAGMSREGTRGMVNIYNLLLYNVAETSAALLLISLYELLADSPLMLQDSSEDASLR